MNVTYDICPFNGNGNGNGDYNGNGYPNGLTTPNSVASSSQWPSPSSIGNGNSIQPSSSSSFTANLSGPFVFNSRQQVLRAPVSGTYTQPEGQRFNLRGILIQRQESPQ